MSGSLADRITSPPAAAADSKTPAPTSGTTGNPLDTTKRSWADDLASPTGTAPPADSNLDDAQVDGSVIDRNGSKLEEGDYEVEISLSELQKDASSDNPLFSLNKSFDSLIS